MLLHSFQMQYYSVIIFAGLLFSIVAERNETYYSYNEDAKELLYDDFKGNITAVYGERSECVITNFTFTYIKGTLNIIFLPCFVGKNYRVILKAKDIFPVARLAPNAEHKTYVPYHGINDSIVEGRRYAIAIFCRPTVTQYFTSPSFVLYAYKTEELDCRFWNISISLFAVPDWHRITVVFAPTPEYELCFKNYTVELFTFDEKCQKERTLNSETVLYNSINMTVTFEDLSPGNYCATVSASHPYCLKDPCHEKITSQPLELSEINPVHPKDKVDSIAIIVPLCLLTVVSIIGIIGARRMKNCLRHPRSTSENEKTVTVAILHAQCIKLQNEVDLAIYDFLKDCCKVHPVIADRNPEVLKRTSVAWIQNYFNYKQLLNERVIQKVLIVETDTAVRLYEDQWDPDKDHSVRLTYREDSHLNDIFPRGLATLVSDPESCGSDHHHIIIVRFPYSTTTLSCFKQRRFHLPHETVELYNSLQSRENLLYNKKNLKNCWKENETHKRLLATIEKVQNYVRNNPNYLDNEVFKYSETV